MRAGQRAVRRAVGGEMIWRRLGGEDQGPREMRQGKGSTLLPLPWRVSAPREQRWLRRKEMGAGSGPSALSPVLIPAPKVSRYPHYSPQPTCQVHRPHL